MPGVDVEVTAAKVVIAVDREPSTVGGVEVVVHCTVWERRVESTVVVDMDTLGGGDNVEVALNVRMAANAAENCVMVLRNPDVGVMGHANAVDGWNDAGGGTEIAFNINIALRVAVETSEGGLRC